MATGRWLDNTRKNMQRLGFLKALALAANAEKGSDMAALSRRFGEVISRKVAIDLAQYPSICRSFLDKKLYLQRYPGIKDKLESVANRSETVPELRLSVELQDIYLGDPRMPSSTGAIPPEAYSEPVRLGASTGILNESALSLGSLGMALRLLDASAAIAFQQYTPDENPLLVAISERPFFLYVLLLADGDMLRRVIAWASQRESFSRAEIGEHVGSFFDELLQKFSRRALTREDKLRITKLQDQRNLVVARGGRGTSGQGQPREHVITFRLEAMVDLGLLSKPNAPDYYYEVTPGLKELDRALRECDSVAQFARERMFTAIASIWGDPYSPPLDDNDRLTDSLKEAGRPLANSLGYMPIEATVLLMNAQFLASHSYRQLEISEVTRRLRLVQQQNPKAVRFTTNRAGEIAYVKLGDHAGGDD